MAFTNNRHAIVSKSEMMIIDSLPGFPISYTEFTTAKNNWKNSHSTGAIQGGSISKDSLEELINTLPLGVTNISFYFATDKNGRTYLMFAPAGASLDSKIYRNGSFCPNNCN